MRWSVVFLKHCFVVVYISVSADRAGVWCCNALNLFVLTFTSFGKHFKFRFTHQRSIPLVINTYFYFTLRVTVVLSCYNYCYVVFENTYVVVCVKFSNCFRKIVVKTKFRPCILCHIFSGNFDRVRDLPDRNLLWKKKN